MAKDTFQAVLDRFVQQSATAIDVCRRYNEEESPPEIPAALLDNHSSFTKQVSEQLCHILEHWFTDGSLDDDQRVIFHDCAAFLLKVSRAQANSRDWLAQQTEMITLTDKCLNEIGSYGYYISIGGTEDASLESFERLIQAMENARCKQLLGTMSKCVCSHFYGGAFQRLHDINALTLSVSQRFLLVTCPNYVLTCDTEKKHCLAIVKQMLGHYNEIYAAFLPYIKDWTIPVILCLVYPIKLILANIRELSFEQKKIIYEIILTILLNKSTIDPNIEQVRISLIYISLSLLIEIIRSDQKLANTVKNITDKKDELLTALNDLAKNDKNNNIQMKALELKALLVPEEEFLQQTSTEELTGLFMKNFNGAVEQGKADDIDEVLTGLKGLVQNDAVKEEIIKQNGLPAILKYAKEVTDDPVPLEITYAMTFNGEAKNVIKQDQEFVDHIKDLLGSDKNEVSKVAHGILWKLEGEEQFRRKQEERNLMPELQVVKSMRSSMVTVASSEPSKDPNKHDIMISYCWAQKALCHKVNDRLEKDGYKVWLDRDEMHGSIIERMAEAIENAQVVIVCMSSNYKNSVNCKAEAEYAFNRKSKIVPLIVEPSYKADGWLGFLAGTKIYVDFADKEDEEFDTAYASLIQELKHNGLGEPGETQEPSEPKTPPNEPEKPLEEPEPPVIQTTEYLTVGPTSVWNSDHVQEFLTHNDLGQLREVCEGMDGQTLTEFYQACHASPEKMYPMVNNPKEERLVSFNTYFKFMSRLKKHLAPPPQQKVYFQYGFVYPPAKPTAKATEDTQSISSK